MNQAACPDHPTSAGASRTWSAIVMLCVVTLLTFANGWPDSLVFDDKAFVGPDPYIKLESFSQAFTEDIWQNEESSLGLYRPLLQIYFELQNRVFDGWLGGYHLLNIFSHLATTLLLFGFLRFLLARSNTPPGNLDLVALLPALVFAVHPAHTEVVNSVFNGSSILVSMFAISSLWWLLSHLDTRPVRAWLGMGVIFSIAILVKESALVLPGIAVAMIILATDGSFTTRVKRMLPVFWLLIPIVIYFWARGHALATDYPGTGAGVQVSGFASMADVFVSSIGQDWTTKAALFGKGLEVLAWPYPLRLFYASPEGTAALLYIALQVLLAAWAVYLLYGGKPGLAAGLAFYYIALAPSIRIVSLDEHLPHITERYLYFPSVGIAIVIATAYRYLAEKFGIRKVSLFSLPLLVFLAALCWQRNSEWASELNLFETEYLQGYRESKALRVLLTSHNLLGHSDRVVQICDENPLLFTDSIAMVNICTVNYITQQRLEDAIAALNIAGAQDHLWIQARISLAAIYIAQRELQKGADLYLEIINGVEEPEQKEMYKGDMFLALYPKSREKMLVARQHYEAAVVIKPGFRPAQKRLVALDELIKKNGNTSLD